MTVLTSLDSRELGEIGFALDPSSQVEKLASLAVGAGLRGLVCSPLEIARLRRLLPAHVKLVSPGIRGGQEKADVQNRSLSAREAIAAGAVWLVIGRPIIAAPDPLEAARSRLKSSL